MNKYTENDIAVSLKDVFKSYPSYDHITGGIKSFLFNIGTSLKELKSRRLVLNGLSVDIYKGESFGFVGRNGAGKSTLLGLIAGVLEQDSGEINIQGRVSPLLQLGAGFHPELSGWENILLNGVLLGLTKETVMKHMQEIIDFSGLHDFIKQPVRTYSSGMYAKLGFAVVSTLEPQILLVDEILAVGDLAFQKKCKDRFAHFHSDPEVTTILVSHSLPTVSEVCTRAAWIEHKKVKMIGPAKDIVKEYTAANTPKSVVPDTVVKLPPHLIADSVVLDCSKAKASTEIQPSWIGKCTTVSYTLLQNGHKIGTWCGNVGQVSVSADNKKVYIESNNLTCPDGAQESAEAPLTFSAHPDYPIEIHAQGLENGAPHGEHVRIRVVHTTASRTTFARVRSAILEKYKRPVPPVAPLWPHAKVVHIVSQTIHHGSPSGDLALTLACDLTRTGGAAKLYAHQSSDDLTGLVYPLGVLEKKAAPQDVILYIDSDKKESLLFVAFLSTPKVLYTISGEEYINTLQDTIKEDEAKEVLEKFDKIICSKDSENLFKTVCKLDDEILHSAQSPSETLEILADLME